MKWCQCARREQGRAAVVVRFKEDKICLLQITIVQFACLFMAKIHQTDHSLTSKHSSTHSLSLLLPNVVQLLFLHLNLHYSIGQQCTSTIDVSESHHNRSRVRECICSPQNLYHTEKWFALKLTKCVWFLVCEMVETKPKPETSMMLWIKFECTANIRKLCCPLVECSYMCCLIKNRIVDWKFSDIERICELWNVWWQ